MSSKNFFLLVVFFFFILGSKSFAVLPFKQSKVISTGYSPNIKAVRGINFKPDGTRMYITNRISDTNENARVTQYTLTTPFDISTAIDPVSTNLVGDGGSIPQLRLPHAIEFKPDGTRIFVTTNKDPTSVYQFKLTTPWDTTTLEFELRFTVDLTGAGNEDQVRALAFKPDGTRMFVGGKDQDVIREYILTTPFDLSDVSVGAISTVDLEDADDSMRNIQFNSDGTKLYIAGDDNNDMKMYSLSTPYDVTTLSSTFTTFDLGSRFSNMRGFIFAFNFTRLFVTDDTLATNTIFEYSLECAGTITCNDPSKDDDIKAIIEANAELSKRAIKNSTLPIFHRIEWLRRHKNKDNLNNLNAEIDFTNEKITRLVSALKNLKKEKDRSYNSDDWFQWSEGRISLGKKNESNASPRDIESYGLSIGADKIKKEDRDTMYGYVFQYGKENIDIGGQGTGLNTNSYGLAIYGTKIDNDDFFADGIIGLSLLDIDHNRVTFGNTLTGDREGRQIFGSVNFGKRLHDEKMNLNPGVKLDFGYTKLKAFREKTITGDSITDVLIYRDQNIKSALASIGFLFDTTDKREDKIINHHGRLEYVGDISPSSSAEFYYVNNQNSIYNYRVNNYSKHNYRIGYGFDITSIKGWSIVTNFERFGARGKGYSNEIYLSVGYVPIDDTEYAMSLDNDKASLTYIRNLNGFDIKMSSNYNLLSEIPDYGAILEISNKF